MGVGAAAARLQQLPTDAGYAVVRDGRATVVAAEPAEVRCASGEDAFALLDHAAAGGWWAGFVAYDLGRAVERVVPRACDDLGLPHVALARYDARLVLDDAAVACAEQRAPAITFERSSLDREAHARAVGEILELLRAGECYQVNLTRRMTADAAPDPLVLFAALERANPAPYASCMTFGSALPGVAIVSASPELFLHVEGREVETRPVKGTAVDAGWLRASAKDRAENVMIVDLARNDLGRVCEFGSIRVDDLCRIEPHPGLHHLVSTVRGRLRAEVSLGELVRATFPPASVTGAPKPRVLQAIEDLEPVRRGVYCGAIGWIDGDGDDVRAELAVAIRTFTIAGGRTHLGVGGGVVADSCAAAEWAETELKAARLLAAAGP